MILTLIYDLAWSVRKQERVIHICDFTTTYKRDCSYRTISTNSHIELVHHERIELNSYADTIVFGRNCVVIHYTERECNVSPYTEAYEPIKSVNIACSRTYKRHHCFQVCMWMLYYPQCFGSYQVIKLIFFIIKILFFTGDCEELWGCEVHHIYF